MTDISTQSSYGVRSNDPLFPCSYTIKQCGGPNCQENTVCGPDPITGTISCSLSTCTQSTSITEPAECCPSANPTSSPTPGPSSSPTDRFVPCNTIIPNAQQCEENADCAQYFTCNDRILPDGELEPLEDEDGCDPNCTCFCLSKCNEVIPNAPECRTNADCPTGLTCNDRILPDGELEPLSNTDECDPKCSCYCL